MWMWCHHHDNDEDTINGTVKAATPGALSEREREARVTLVFVDKPAGEGNSEVSPYMDGSDGGLSALVAIWVEVVVERSRGRG